MTDFPTGSLRASLPVAAGVAGLAFAAHAPSLSLGFVSLDDRTYVTANAIVRSGLTAAGFRWAWTTFYAANWHPLTWLSLMADAQFGGGAAATFHLTNVLLHAANAALLFVFLHRATGRTGPSALVAALFGVHPLHVESVAWVVERKDVLSTFFWFLALLAYLRHARAPSFRSMAVVAGCLAASLLAKPMLVTAPLLLLLVDFWPLDRAGRGAAWRSLILEKWPLALLAAASSIVTVAAQTHGGAVQHGTAFPWTVRLANAVLSYAAYLADAFWPLRLAVFYPHPGIEVSASAAAACALLLAGLSVAAIAARRIAPYLLAGFGWFLVGLAPVIGLVQVGLQARADRYTYVPLIGVFVIVAWGVPDLIRFAAQAAGVPARPSSRTTTRVLAAISIVAVASLGVLAWRQTRLWSSEVALFEHALRVTRNNDFAQAALGSALAVRGEFAAARTHFDEALRLNPRNVEARHERGVLFLRENEPARAEPLFRSLLADEPPFEEARGGLAAALLAQGDFQGAEQEAAIAIQTAPWVASAHAVRGALRLRQGRLAEAETSFAEAARLDPANADYQTGLGNAAAGSGKDEAAITAYRAAIRLRPDSFEAHLPLGALLFRNGRTAEGLTHLETAVRLSPGSAEARLNLGVALYKSHRRAEAIAEFERILASDPANSLAATYLRMANATATPEGPAAPD